MSDSLSLALLVTINILVALYGLVITRQVHREVAENVLLARTTLDAAIAILRHLRQEKQ
jgi:hypothetical protein